MTDFEGTVRQVPEAVRPIDEIVRDLRRFARMPIPLLESDGQLHELVHNQTTVVSDIATALAECPTPMTRGRRLTRQGTYFSASQGDVYQGLDLSGGIFVGEPPRRFIGCSLTIEKEHRSLDGAFDYSWRLRIPLYGDELPRVDRSDLDTGAWSILANRYDSGTYPDDKDSAYRMFAAWLTQAAAAEVADFISPEY